MVFSWSITVGLMLWALDVPQWVEKNILKNRQEQYREKIEELETRINILENRKADSGNGTPKGIGEK